MRFAYLIFSTGYSGVEAIGVTTSKKRADNLRSKADKDPQFKGDKFFIEKLPLNSTEAKKSICKFL